jgi:hypothetical protein
MEIAAQNQKYVTSSDSAGKFPHREINHNNDFEITKEFGRLSI